MLRKKLMAAGLSALMLLSGGVLVMGEETAESAASAVSETVVESNTETADGENDEAAAASASETAEDITIEGETDNSTPDYEYDFYYETYTGTAKTYLRAIIDIKNVSEDKVLYVSDASIDLEDKDGHLLRCINDMSILPRVIYPGNTGFVYCDGENMDGIDNIDEVNAAPDFVIRSTDIILHNYPDSDISFKVGGDRQIEANGRITNDTENDVSNLDVKIVYMDKDLNVLGIGGTSINDIPAGATRSFGMTGLIYGDINNIGNAEKYELYVSEPGISF